MLRTGAQYLDGIRDGREVYLGGERVRDVTTHPALAPIIRARARIYDMAHESAHAGTLAYSAGNESHSIFNRPPTTKADWHAKWRAVDAVLRDLGGVVTRVGDETVGEMWSLQDGRDILAEIDPRFAANIDRHTMAFSPTSPASSVSLSAWTRPASRHDKTIFATLHALLIISEAARKLGAQAEMLRPGQPWAGIRDIGNVLRHDYDDVDPAAMWRVLASGDLASLRQAVTEAIARKGLPS